MGVRGLTSYIARHAELYLTPYELHDENLVIDGDNLACNLYKDVSGTYSAFGGDYDDFYRAVVEFFHVLAECNVRPYVLMDGGYEQRKLRTVAKRLRGKIAVIKRINPCGSVPVFPLLMKEVFVDAVRDCGVPLMRCIFEADDELAALSRKLRCPVLSYDSDFYIHNVRYIPLVTLTMKAHVKRLKEGEKKNNQPTRKLRKNEAKHFEKRTKANRILSEIHVDNVEKRSQTRVKTYKYLDCCMYRIENLIARRSLSEEKLPLFAALLGNDYIARGCFKNFFAVGLGKSGRSRKMKQQQHRIRVILEWLKHESAESALEKIFSRLRKNQRGSLLAQVDAAISGYSNEVCHSYDFFMKHYEIDLSDLRSKDFDEDYEDVIEEQEENVDEATDEETEESEEEETAKSAANRKQVNGNEQEKDQVGEHENVDDGSSQSDEEVTDEDELDVEDKVKLYPVWFLKKLYPAHLPRFFVDLLHLKKYINSPQIEHFPYNDCNELALPILTYIFTLLHSVEGEQNKSAIKDVVDPQTPTELTYLSRAPRVTNIRYQKYPLEELPSEYLLDPNEPNPLLFKRIFENSMPDLDEKKLFESINLLPQDLQLYFLAIIYWLQKSQHSDLVHLHSLLVCVVVLRTIDAKIPVERDLRMFQKRFGKLIKKEKLIRSKESLEGVKRGMKEELLNLAVPERMPYVRQSDCYLVQDNLLKHFHMQEIFKKKYDLYSTTVLHGFAEFQSVVFQLHSLNALLDFPYISPRMGQLYCGVFLYNIYDSVHSRVDLRYHVQNFIFQDSPLMYDFYCFLLDWCDPFVPHWKQQQMEGTVQSASKKLLKKQRQAARKMAAKQTVEAGADPNASMVEQSDSVAEDEDEFYDLNNKFCTFLKVH